MRDTRLFWRIGLVLASVWLLGAGPSMAAPTAEELCSSRMAEASGRYLDCAMRENGRAAKHRRAVNLDRCERKLGRMTAGALRRWGPEVCPSVNQVGGGAMTLGDQLNGLVSQMSEAVGVSNEDLSDDAALCAAKKAKVLGQDLRCRAQALARGTLFDRPANEAACSERRLKRKLERIDRTYGAECPAAADGGALATREKLAISEVTSWVAPSMERHAGVTDPVPTQRFPDADGDGVPDNLEIALLGTNPIHPDTDRDGRPDGLEFFYDRSDPLEYDAAIATQGTGGSAKNARLAVESGVLALAGIPDTPIGMALTAMSVYCAFDSCNSGYTGEATRARVDLLSSQIAGEFTALNQQIMDVSRELTNIGKRILTSFEKQNCSNTVRLIPDLTQENCTEDPLSVQCIHSHQRLAVSPTGGHDVRPLFEKFGKGGTEEFLLRGKLLSGINNGHGQNAMGYRDTIKGIQSDCRDLIKDKQLISADSNMLGGDLMYQRLMASFLTGSLHTYRAAIGFLSTFRSAQAWYYASPELRKDALWLAMQDQSTALVPVHDVPQGQKRCRYSKEPCSADRDCGSIWDTCQASYTHYDSSSGCAQNEVLVGNTENGRCVEVQVNDENVWASTENGFNKPASVTIQAMQAMNHICEAWSLHHPKPCSYSPGTYTTGYYCQQQLCEPVEGSSLNEVVSYWKIGRDYINSLLAIGAPFTNSDFVYEPTRDVMWLKNPGWGVTAAGGPYLGVPNSRFFYYNSSFRDDYTVASWPSSENEKEKVVLTPATRAHWMGEGSAVMRPNTDGMGAAAQFGSKKCSQTGSYCRVAADCEHRTSPQTCGENAQNQLRADFAPTLLEGMAKKGDLTWQYSNIQKIGTCSPSSPNASAACDTDQDCAYRGAGECQEANGQSACHGGARHGAPCEQDWQCRERDPVCSDNDPLSSNKGEACVCRNNPADSAATFVRGHPGNLACAAGWTEWHLLVMGASIHGTIASPRSVVGMAESMGEIGSIGSTPMYGYLKDSWGFNSERDFGLNAIYGVPEPGTTGSCPTKLRDLMPYPYVREFTRVGGRLSRDYGLAGLSGGQSVDCNSDLDFSDVNIHDLIHGSNMGLNNTADMVGDSDSIFQGSVGGCDHSSPVGMFGAWPNHPAWPDVSSATHGYNVGLNFGLSCNWLDAHGKFSRCEDDNWDGGECSSRKRTVPQNSLNFKTAKACARANHHPFEFTYTTTTGNACRNLEGDVECSPFDGLAALLHDSDSCLYPIKERKGSTAFTYRHKAFPIACASASEGCTSNSGAPSGRNWINFRQCLSFSEASNCAHLGVQTPYLLTVAQMPPQTRIWSIVTPGGVASSTEMVAAYAVNSLSRGFGCGSTTVLGKSHEHFDENLTVADTGFLRIQGRIAERPQFMWPVVDLFAAGHTGQLVYPEVATQDNHKPIKRCSTSKKACSTDEECITETSFGGGSLVEKCVDVIAERDSYARICPGAHDWTDWESNSSGAALYSLAKYQHVDSVMSCMEQVTGSQTFDLPNHDPQASVPSVCSRYFGPSVTWDSDHVSEVVQHCRGDEEVSYRCHEHCMWALKCWDGAHSIGADHSTGVKNLQKIAALHEQNFDAMGRDPSSCCSEGLCENQLQQSIASAVPAVFASYQPPKARANSESAARKTCYSRDEAWVNKVDGLQDCMAACHECDGSSSNCDGLRCEYAHYNATWCTLFPHCETEIEDPYGGHLYTRADVEAYHAESNNSGLLGDADWVPPGAIYGNRLCIDQGSGWDANQIVINGLSLSECADACAQQNYWQRRKECTESREWCKTNSDCGSSGGTCEYVRDIRIVADGSEEWTWEKYDPAECGFFSFYGGKWNHAEMGDCADCREPEHMGSETTCTLYPKEFFGSVQNGLTCQHPRMAPQGWAVWPAPKETTWSRHHEDCTKPGQDPRGRECSRGVSESYARVFLDQGFAEVQHKPGKGLSQGSQCSSAAACDSSLGLTCRNGRCAGPAPGEAQGPCVVEKKCHKSHASCTIGSEGHDSCGTDDQCIPIGTCHAGLTCTYGGSPPSGSSGFWMTHSWKPGGICRP